MFVAMHDIIAQYEYYSVGRSGESIVRLVRPVTNTEPYYWPSLLIIRETTWLAKTYWSMTGLEFWREVLPIFALVSIDGHSGGPTQPIPSLG